MKEEKDEKPVDNLGAVFQLATLAVSFYLLYLVFA
jgi:hypothetical protein